MNSSDTSNKKDLLLSADIASKTSNNNSKVEKDKSRFSFRYNIKKILIQAIMKMIHLASPIKFQKIKKK